MNQVKRKEPLPLEEPVPHPVPARLEVMLVGLPLLLRAESQQGGRMARQASRAGRTQTVIPGAHQRGCLVTKQAALAPRGL